MNMLDFFSLRVVVLGVSLLSAAACSSSTDTTGTGGSSSSSTTSSGQSSTTSGANTTGVTTSTGATSSASGGGDPTFSIAPGDCFTFATAMKMDSGGMTCGDLLALSGANVDLSGAGSNLCDLPGPYASLSAVPTDYSTCNFMSYIEGGNGLANHGLIVRDAATGTHHYRARIVSNTQPSLVFSFAKID